MKFLKVIGFVFLAILLGIQFIPRNYNRAEEIPASDLMKVMAVPGNVEKILTTSCYDCHSNNTNYPWYSHVQPFAFYLADHIEDGKSELNFSEFGEYSERRQKSKLRSSLSQVEDGEMPLSSYTLVHKDARLSEKEKRALMEWIEKVLRGDPY